MGEKCLDDLRCEKPKTESEKQINNIIFLTVFKY